jgi:hypothetical protein
MTSVLGRDCLIEPRSASLADILVTRVAHRRQASLAVRALIASLA